MKQHNINNASGFALGRLLASGFRLCVAIFVSLIFVAGSTVAAIPHAIVVSPDEAAFVDQDQPAVYHHPFELPRTNESESDTADENESTEGGAHGLSVLLCKSLQLNVTSKTATLLQSQTQLLTKRGTQVSLFVLYSCWKSFLS